MDLVQAQQKIKSGPLSGLYLLSGQDSFSKKIFLKSLRQAIEKRNGHDVSVESIEDCEPTNLSWHLSQGSLIAKKRLLLISSAPYQEKGEQQQKKLENILLKHLKKEDPQAVLVFCTEKVDRRKKIVRAIEKQGCCIDFTPLQGEALIRFLKDVCKQKELSYQIDALEELVIRRGENLNALTSELEKAALYLSAAAGRETVLTPEIVRKLCFFHHEANIFQLAEAVGKHETTRALKMLKIMLQQKEPPPLILFMLARHYRLLYQAFAAPESWQTPNILAGKIGVPRRAAVSLLEQVRLYSRETLARAFILLAETDYQVKKGQRTGEAALELLIWRLAAFRKTAG